MCFSNVCPKVFFIHCNHISADENNDDRKHICNRKHNVARMCGDYNRRGIGLTTGFIGSHTVTHNYSVYVLQLTTVHLPSLHTVSTLVACLPISQDPFACNSATLLWRLLLGPTTNSSVFWRLALCNSLDSTAPAHTRRPTDWLGSHSKTDWTTTRILTH
jgi:hypothetical protein